MMVMMMNDGGGSVGGCDGDHGDENEGEDSAGELALVLITITRFQSC